MIYNLFKKLIAKQFIRFCLVGTFNAILYYSIYLFLNRIFSLYYLLANFVGAFISITSSFILNKNWTFRNKDNRAAKQYIKFWIMALCGLGFNEIILFLLVKYFGIYDLLAMAFAIAIVLFWNFTVGKHWVFKNLYEETV